MEASLKLFLRNSFNFLGFAVAATVAATSVSFAQNWRGHDFDRVVVIMMENHGFDQVIGPLLPTADSEKPNQPLLTPYITNLAQTQGLATYYFGVTHPSLPNYLATIAGDYFGVQDDNDSCYVQPGPTSGCHNVNAQTIVDQLEKKNISWEALMESMPSGGYLGSRYPASPGQKLYAQKHNPFVYFDNIVSSSARMAKIKPLDLSALTSELSNPTTASRFIYIAPNQCNDQHGTGGTIAQGAIDCSTDALTLAAGDNFLKNAVPAIVNSAAFTNRSALFIVWDENDYSGQMTCCGPSPTGVGGGHIATFVVTKHGQPLKSAQPYDHYSLLATIEDGFDLPRLANARSAHAMWDLIPGQH
jgi:phosphatidylinositol-3-phosphatase